MMIPKYSIIVPIYKAEEYIDRCIQSILNQTYNDWELILVDDGSPDNSGVVCDNYASKDCRVKVLHQANQGVSVARNNGLDNACGEYILFLDSDDWLDLDCLEFCINRINSSEAEILQFSTIRVTSQNGECQAKTAKDGEVFNADEYIAQSNFFVCIGGTIVRREVVETYNIRFRNDIKLAEDQMFIMDCLKRASRVYRTDYPFYKYFVNDNSATSNSRSQSMIDSVNALIKYKRVNPEYTTTIDYTLLYFLWYIINNKDITHKYLACLVKNASLSISWKFSRWERFFITLSNHLPLLSIYYVLIYKKLRG